MQTPPRSFRRICVYCGSSNHVDERYKAAARAMGRVLVTRGIDLVYGGGSVGLMGIIADTVLEGGGRVFGVIPRRLYELEVGHDGCTELFVVDGMHSRKMLMMQLSDAFVALPGGFGTMEELFEVTTWTQLQYQDKPVGVLDVDDYYAPLLQWIAHAHAEKFIRDQHRHLIVSNDQPGALLDQLATATLPGVQEWIRDV